MKPKRAIIAALGLFGLVLLTVYAGGRAVRTPAEGPPSAWDGLMMGMNAFTDVPYLPTPHEIAEEMIRLAGVTADDVVYDLGCGDGRLVIAAAARRGARGVGVDIDPDLVAESREKARLAGVEDRVRFVRQNFFETDVREATVVLIYLLPEINLRLRPKLIGEMKPGSRLVSHAFDMGEWQPDGLSKIGLQSVYLWVIPANVTGRWTWTLPGEPGEPHVMQLSQEFQRIRGELFHRGVKTEINGAQLAGDRIAFAVEQAVDGVLVSRRYAGVVEGDRITGTVVSGGGVREQSRRWLAVRDAATARPIDVGPRGQELPWY